jgi:hypothetical protein
VDSEDPAIPGGLLWHYTDFNAFEKIISTDVMRASSLFYLNDAKEYAHGMEMLEHAGDMEGFPDVGLPNGASIGPAMVNHARGYLRHNLQQDIYVTCFSEEPDDLSQWRGYASTPPSFALGFDRERLKERALTQGLEMHQVEYDSKGLLNFFYDKMLHAVNSAVSKADKSDPHRTGTIMLTAREGEWSGFALMEMSKIIARNKSESFKAEREVRLVQRLYGPNPPNHKPYEQHFRKSGSQIVPYIEWKLRGADSNESSLTALIVGPGPHKAEVAKVAKRMLDAKSHSSVDVFESRVPFRNW